MTATRVRLLWSPRHLAPSNSLELATAVERVIPRVAVTVELSRDRYGWRVEHAGAMNDDGPVRPSFEYKREVVWALQRAGLPMRDCPLCGDPIEIVGKEPRHFELRTRGVAPDQTHARYYAHRYATACTPLDAWARFTVPCACGRKLPFVMKASESVESGGELACGCGTRYALESRLTGGGIAVDGASVSVDGP
jgi:hypothetical protein